MSALSTERCVACRRDSPRITEAEIAELRPAVSDWQLLERDGIARLERVFHFPNFADAMAFTNRVGALAEAEGHHPAILTEWGRVTVTWWTHKIRGLHRNDFIMAAKTDGLAPESRDHTLVLGRPRGDHLSQPIRLARRVPRITLDHREEARLQRPSASEPARSPGM